MIKVLLLSLANLAIATAPEKNSTQIELPEKVSAPRITFSTFLEIPTHSFLISTKAGRSDFAQVDQRVQYNPTFGPNVGISGSYDAFALTFAKELSLLSEGDREKYGESQYDDWRLTYSISKHFDTEIYYQNYLGFYTDLSGQEGLQSSFGPGASGSRVVGGETNIIKRSDIKAINYGVRVQYRFPIMPLIRVFAKKEEQEKLNWNFDLLSKLYYNRLAISGAQPLVPGESADSFSPIANLEQIWTHTLGVGFGVGFSVPVEKNHFGVDFLLGAGLQRQSNVFSDKDQKSTTVSEEINTRLHYSWIGTKNTFQTQLLLDTFSSSVNDINLDSSSISLLVAYSYKL